VSWEQRIEAAVQNGGFWLAHLNYVAFWVLLALALLLLGLRLLLRQIVLRRHGVAEANGSRGWPLGVAAVALLPASLLSWYMAVRPDTTFYETIAGSAFEAGDCRRAVEYYTLLVDWGSRDLQVHTRLAACQLQLGRLEQGVRALAGARVLPGGDTPALRLWAARALEALGRRAEAARELEAALGMTPPGSERDQLAVELARVRAAGAETR
jgi:tetratricopeptide (TPR) repeat protein